MSGNSSNSYGSESRPSCKHGSCHLGTSFTIENPGRRYWGCPLYNSGGGCAFFQWIDAPYEGSVRTALLKVIRKLQFVEEEKQKIEEEKQKIEEEKQKIKEKMKNMKVELDANLVKLKAENRSLKHALKRTTCYNRAFGIFFLWFLSLLVLLWLLSLDRPFVGGNKALCLP